jgi:Sulfotransferase domain
LLGMAKILDRLVFYLRGRTRGEESARIQEQNLKLRRARQQVTKKDRELEALRAELDRARGALSLAGYTGRTFPVFFVVGFAKSGTSWVARILDAHPEVVCKGEGIFFGRGADLGERRGLLTPTSLYGALADSEYMRAWVERSIWTRGDDVDRHLTNLTRMAIGYFLGEKLAASGKRIVGDKTPFVTGECLKEIKSIFPEAKVIHVIRDGRDIAVSAVHHHWNHAKDAGGHLNIKPEELAKRDAYRKNPAAFLASGESIFDEVRLRKGFAEGWNRMTAKAVQEGSVLLGENYTEVRYEALLERPAEEIGRLLRFLGADDGEETVRRCMETTSFERLSKGRKRGEEDSSSFLRKGIAGDWRSVFTKRDKEVFKEAAGDLLIQLGYEKDDNW